MEKLFTGWVFMVSEFCFFFLFFFSLRSLAPAGKYSDLSAEGLPSMFGDSGQWAPVGVPAVWRAGSGGVSVAACLFFQCIMA
jgi:hypothetical protein